MEQEAERKRICSPSYNDRLKMTMDEVDFVLSDGCIVEAYQDLMNFHSAVSEATRIAFEENADQVVGFIQGEWAIAHNEDLGRQAQMERETIHDVDSTGILN